MKLKIIIIVSIIILVLWIIILKNPNISNRVKRWISAIVIVSPIPPIP